MLYTTVYLVFSPIRIFYDKMVKPVPHQMDDVWLDMIVRNS